MNIIKVCIIGMSFIIISGILKENKSSYSIYINMAVCIIIFFYVLSKLEILIELINEVQGYININAAYIKALVKMIGIAYVAEFTSSICKDAGYQAISGQIDIFGKLSILIVSVPVLKALLKTIEGLLA